MVLPAHEIRRNKQIARAFGVCFEEINKLRKKQKLRPEFLALAEELGSQITEPPLWAYITREQLPLVIEALRIAALGGRVSESVAIINAEFPAREGAEQCDCGLDRGACAAPYCRCCGDGQ